MIALYHVTNVHINRYRHGLHTILCYYIASTMLWDITQNIIELI